MNHTAGLIEFSYVEGVSGEQPEHEDCGHQKPKARSSRCITSIGRQTLQHPSAVKDTEEPKKSEEALWGLVYYVKSLMDLKDTPAATELTAKLTAPANMNWKPAAETAPAPSPAPTKKK